MPAERMAEIVEGLVAQQADTTPAEGYERLLHEAGFSRVASCFNVMGGGIAALAQVIRRAQALGQIDQALDPSAIGRVLLSLYYGLELQKALDPSVEVAPYSATVSALLHSSSPRP